MITLIGLGVHDGDISLNAYNEIKKADKIFVRTATTESCKFLERENIAFTSFDEAYLHSRSFDSLNKKIVREVLKNENCCYLVDGSVDEDETCKIILKRRKNVRVFNGVSKGVNALAQVGQGGSYTSVSAYDIDEITSSSLLPLTVFDIDDRLIAGRIKEKLSDCFGEEKFVYFFNGKKFKKIKIYELDREKEYSLSCCLVLLHDDLKEKQRFCYEDLLEIIRVLRGRNGCPWDRVQTPESILKNLIEECYELVDAIKSGDEEKITEEIGDVLLQCAFHTVFGEEKMLFSSNDVLSGICLKLISRHTHVFGQDKANSGEEALNVWEKNKTIEKNITSVTKDVKAVPKIYPALIRGQKVYKRYLKGFNEKADKEKILGDIKNCEDVGKLLFAVCSLAHLNGVDAEEELTKFIDEFISEIEKRENLSN